MIEDINPYNPNSEKPSEFMGNWVDKDTVEKDEQALTKRTNQERLEAEAIQLFDTWKASRLLDNGTYEPFSAETTDIEWAEGKKLKIHAGSNMGVNESATFDLANTPYEELPYDWRGKDNLEEFIHPKPYEEPYMGLY
jgi:hypothetical protein